MCRYMYNCIDMSYIDICVDICTIRYIDIYIDICTIVSTCHSEFFPAIGLQHGKIDHVQSKRNMQD